MQFLNKNGIGVSTVFAKSPGSYMRSLVGLCKRADKLFITAEFTECMYLRKNNCHKHLEKGR